MNLHGKNNNIEFESTIEEGKDNNYIIKSKSNLSLTDYNITPPKMFFLEVRNRIDLNIVLNLSK